MNREDKMKSRAQSTLEYAVVIAVAVAALIAMSAYIKRGMQGRMRSNTDQLSGGFAYSPGATTGVSFTAKSSEENTESYSVKSMNPSGTQDEVGISRSWGNVIQETNRQEILPSFSAEPKR
ncbi:MAG: hypothetical protein FJZ15_06930 [Candidatus Omnitrophica bacterium]|nr:hypothetical protein [Candidatus Omnitrophota bacterium]